MRLPRIGPTGTESLGDGLREPRRSHVMDVRGDTVAGALEDTIYREIKRAIVTRSLGPGAPLQEQELADYFGSSRTPVRAAFRRLEQEKLIQIIPNRGTFVVNPSHEEIAQVFEVRTHLEALATRLAAERITPEQLEHGRKLIAEERRAYDRNQPGEIFRISTEFHELIAEASGNEWLRHLISQSIARCVIYLAFFDDIDPAHPKSPGWHESILMALAARDADEAAGLMTEHVIRLEKDLTRSPVVPPAWVRGKVRGGI